MKIIDLCRIFGLKAQRGVEYGVDPSPVEMTAYFAEALESITLQPETAKKVGDIIEALGIPYPNDKSFLWATDGALLFLNPYGVVLRIEGREGSELIDDNPWVLKPIARRSTGDGVVVEICPGCLPAKERDARIVSKSIIDTGVNFTDEQAANTGLLPFKTAKFPKGVPVVIDRPAVDRLTEQTRNVAEALKAMGAETDPQEQLYSGLRKAFQDAWPEGAARADAEKMKAFWQLCRDSVDKGVLVSGWMPGYSRKMSSEFYKRGEAYAAALSYGRQLKL